MSNTIKVRRGVAANLPTLEAGELAWTTDAEKLYVGDGATNNAVLMASQATAAGLALLDDANAAAQLATLGLTATAAELNLIDVPAPATFTDSLFIGGGGVLVSRTGTNPIDPLEFESDGTYNGLFNTFIGIHAGDDTVTGNCNLFVGDSAGADNINGDQNTYMGDEAGKGMLDGYHNTYLGCAAGKYLTHGEGDVFIGTDTAAHSAGNDNTIVGTSAGYIIAGDNNVFIGRDAALDTEIGSGNVFIGKSAGKNGPTTINGSVAIGWGAINTASHQAVIGDEDLTEVRAGEDAQAKFKGAGLDTSGDITLGENTAVALDPAGSADEKWSGITVTGTAGATLAVGDLCYLNSGWEWVLADADAASTSGSVALGLCILAANNDGATNMLLLGTMRSAAFPASIAGGVQLYVSQTAGDMTTTIPTGADVVVRVCGWAILTEPNTIYFNPSSDFITRVS